MSAGTSPGGGEVPASDTTASALAAVGRGRQQAQVAPADDGVGPAVAAELGVQVAHVGLNGVRGDEQLTGEAEALGLELIEVRRLPEQEPANG